MFQLLHSTLIFIFFLDFCNTKSIFDFDADDILKSMIGEISRLPHRIAFPDIKGLLYPKKDKKTPKYVMKTNPTTTKMIVQATVHPSPRKVPEITIRDINIRKMNMNLARLFSKHTSLPDFANGADDPSHETRRFDAIRAKMETYEPTDFLRQEYFYNENGTKILMEKNKTIELMAHYVYETRYKLPYSQLMREKYKDDVRYKLGYCFSLLRQLKQQQRLIYSTLMNHYLKTVTLHFHMKMYEKVVRLDVDVRDLIQYIKDLERHRRLMVDPTYYDDNK
ncbi:uncharacterized protein LOC115449562 [Manduca sexta]|uniref:Uncharacterized protein n=1 Tax=Manduca sexta TaxID=7130 RepID=A0A922CV61_MANSE|nr:uncharacterized protein LOC115449562 [Manduca sexta]KAG6459577.1 hypothetical protein O3G_MSEX011457 [Manduca sexta]